MTSDRPPLDDLDLSAVLDGDADDDVLARLAGEPGARDRLERLRAAQAAVAGASVEPLPERTVDSLVANAIAAGDAATGPSAGVTDGDGADAGATDDGIVAPLPSRRRKPVPAWAVAAVVIALVAIGLTLVWGGLDEADDDVAFEQIGASIAYDDTDGGGESAAEDAAASAPAGTDDASAGASHFEGEATTTAPTTGASSPRVVALGEFADADALRVHLRDAFPTESIESGTARADEVLTAAARCTGKLDGLFGASGEPTVVGSATVAGEAVVAYELPFRTDDGRDTTLVMAIGEATCIPVLSFQR